MKLVFVSNYLNHHQKQLCDELANLSTFTFITTDCKNEQGFQRKIEAPYVVFLNEELDGKNKCIQLINESDICIFGSCPNYLIEERMKTNKISFLYTERFFKKGMWRRFIPSTLKRIKNRVLKFKNKNLFVLCAGRYVADELKLLHFSINKCFKWGYFPELKIYSNVDKLLQQKKDTILWCGRFLNWKHPELMVKAGKILKAKGIPFNMKMIGEGPERDKIIKLIKKNSLSEQITVLNSMSPQEIRREMELASIFVQTSDSYEGWGAVVNEAMNSGCLVICSPKIGSATFLINDLETGLLFKNKNAKSLSKKILFALKNKDKNDSIRRNSIKTISSTWNAKEAAQRLILLSNKLLSFNNETHCFDNGPCSGVELKKK